MPFDSATELTIDLRKNNYPNQGYARVCDEFLMGEDLLVAPQMEKRGASSRAVLIPPGVWLSDTGERLVGPCTVTKPTPLNRLPHFVRQGASAAAKCHSAAIVGGYDPH